MRRAVKALNKVEREVSNSKKKCIICNGSAEYCMRGLENNTYCRECALEHFKFLNYLERLE